MPVAVVKKTTNQQSNKQNKAKYYLLNHVLFPLFLFILFTFFSNFLFFSIYHGNNNSNKSNNNNKSFVTIDRLARLD